MKATLFFCSLLLSFSSLAQRILLLHGTAHIGNGTVVESAAIGVVNDRITFIKNSLTQTFNNKDWDTIINCNGQHLYPGLVSANNTLGLTEIDAVRATRDFNDVGDWNPHVRAQVAYNVESKVVETVRTNGVLLVQATPRGGWISGSSAVMKLSGWNWEDATVLADDGIHLNWPTVRGTYQAQKREIYTFFELAKTYALARDAQTTDLRLEAMKACFKGQKRVYIHAESIQQIVDVIDFAAAFQLPFPVIVGGHDAHLVGAKLRDSKIPVMLSRIHSLPQREDELTYLPYQMPALLKQQGIAFCIQNDGDMQPMNTRNLPFQAGTTMAYGLTEEEALKAISLSVCQIMGIDKDYGTLEVGKKATFFVSKGPALDMRSNQLTTILVDGQFVSTTNFQEELYLKYRQKYKAEAKSE
ncbi:MAG: amidohydrolase family protein [Crocinitomicaceae bacterium]|nr:amidohydrolase family protein [Crocinitomicaceae bacterium]MDP4723677.1 amidohydrolase family protein [Crocinitomicaceae bacterium]MDP4738536.1 amidohydrolase family protein [Crocinitomicaceae bacterium]MDP4798674.1 amidohydrolase family protein [Crocinitomicaceae bacterium]MDP4806364.1 amidohydrolase family protein [Crocinitomicaceae bacterium]